MKLFSDAFWRGLRSAASLGIAGAIAWAANDPKWIWLAPIITGVAKLLRDKFGWDKLPV